ncbi:major histocompatibility complex class I-related gene protein-like isoform 2-T2 [Vipera latastei]
MRLSRAPLLLLGAVLGASLIGGGCCSPTHFLCYFYLHQPEPSQGLSQFPITAYLDDQPIARFDSLTWKMEPLVPWMEDMDKEMFLHPARVFRADLEKLSKLGHQTGGLHTWQAVLGCQLREDGGKGGFLRYGYDGMDFISFDKETLRWVAAQPQAQKVKDEWEDDPGRSEINKVFLEETCIEWLQIYQSYRKEALQRMEPPVGKVTHKEVDDSLEVLICQAFGFYPKEIQATWMRDGEIWKNKTLQRNVAPNSDGTYYFWLSIEIDPKERDHFWCRLEHQGLQEPLILGWKEETGWQNLVAISLFVLFLGLGIFFLIGRWRRFRNNLYQEVTTCHDLTPSKSIPSFFIYHTNDEVQSVLSSQTSEHKASSGLQRTQSDPEIAVLSLCRQEVKPLQKKKNRVIYFSSPSQEKEEGDQENASMNTS